MWEAISSPREAEKFKGDWLMTGDLGSVDEEGYITYSSRDDDVITSAGYRIGPTEIEECLTGHDAVAMAAAIGVPDAERGEVVKAFVVYNETLLSQASDPRSPKTSQFVDLTGVSIKQGGLRPGVLRKLYGTFEPNYPET